MFNLQDAEIKNDYELSKHLQRRSGTGYERAFEFTLCSGTSDWPDSARFNEWQNIANSR